MTLLQMQYFCEIARLSNYSRASELLHVSQSALSKAMKELEQELGVRLFLREKNNLLLTEEGRVFREEAARVLMDMEGLTQRMLEARHHSSLLHIGAVPALAHTAFSGVLTDFTARYPDRLGRYMVCSGAQIRSMLARGMMNVGLVSTPDNVPGGFTCTELGKREIVACMSRSHPLAGREYLTPKELSGQRLALLSNLDEGTAADRLFRDILFLAGSASSSLKNYFLMQLSDVFALLTSCGFVSLLCAGASALGRDIVEAPLYPKVYEGVWLFSERGLSPDDPALSALIRELRGRLSR